MTKLCLFILLYLLCARCAVGMMICCVFDDVVSGGLVFPLMFCACVICISGDFTCLPVHTCNFNESL